MIVTGAGTVVDYNGNDLTLGNGWGGGPGLIQATLNLLDGATMTGLQSLAVGSSSPGDTTIDANVLVDNATLNVPAGAFGYITIGDPWNGGPVDANFVAQNGAQITTNSFNPGTNTWSHRHRNHHRGRDVIDNRRPGQRDICGKRCRC